MASVGHQGFWVYGIQLFKLVYGFFRFNSATPSRYRIFCASSMFGYTKEIWGWGGYTRMGNCFEYQITLPTKSSYLFLS